MDAGEYEAIFYAMAEQEGVKDPAEIEYRVGNALLNTGAQTEYAALHLRNALEKNPKHTLAWFALGLIEMGTDEGNGYIQKAIESDPDFAEGYYWLGYNNLRDGKDEIGQHYLEQFLEKAKGQPAEAGRVLTAKEVLADLKAGTMGESLAIIRRKAA